MTILHQRVHGIARVPSSVGSSRLADYGTPTGCEPENCRCHDFVSNLLRGFGQGRWHATDSLAAKEATRDEPEAEQGEEDEDRTVECALLEAILDLEADGKPDEGDQGQGQ
jgi:hypothetical protein